MVQDEHDSDDGGDPIEMLASFCEAHGWPHDCTGDEEVSAQVDGSWGQYELRGIWRDEDGVLQLLLLPQIVVPDDQRPAMWETISLINEQLWMGHFELWSSSGIIAFRNPALIGEDGVSLSTLELVVHTAIEECERFYPVFQFVLWGGKTPQEAIAAALIETRGEA